MPAGSPVQRGSYLKARHLAECFQVPLRTVYHWVSRQGLPGEQVGEQYYFHPLQVLDWAMGKGLPLYSSLLFSDAAGAGAFTAAALQRGQRLALQPAGADRQAGWLASLIAHLPPGDAAGQRLALEALQQLPRARPRVVRDELALPSPWAPWPSPGNEAALWIFRCSPPARLPLWQARPVTHWFWLLTPNPAHHWQLLEHLYQQLSHGPLPEWVAELEFSCV